MSKLNDDDAALSDIAHAPEVSGEGVDTPRKPLNVRMAQPDLPAEDKAADERNARLFVSGVSSVAEQFAGKPLLEDQVEALAELARMGLSALRAAAMPKPVYIGLLGLILVIPAIPPLFKLITAKPKEAPHV